jgi:hypothetical protein
MPKSREEKCEDMLRDDVRAIVRHIADGDTTLLTGFGIDMVIADRAGTKKFEGG